MHVAIQQFGFISGSRWHAENEENWKLVFDERVGVTDKFLFNMFDNAAGAAGDEGVH